MNKEELEKKLKEENLSLKDAIQLRGQLITILKKELREQRDPKLQLPIKVQLHEELKKHKEVLKKRGLEDSIPLPERVGLKVKEIANTIEIFKEKHDLIGKIKSSAISTTIGTLIAGAITVGISVIGGAPLTLATLATAIPTIAFCGISGVLRTPFTETTWTKLVKSIDSKDKNQKAILEFIDQNIKDNKPLMELLQRKSKKPNEQELISINKELIEEYTKLIGSSPVPELSKILTFEKINLSTEQKKIYEKIKNEYIKNKRQMTTKEFTDLEKELISTNLQITKENSFYKEVLKESGKELALSSGILVATSAIISAAFPQLGAFNIQDLTVPMIITLIGNLANMGTLKNKIKLEKEQYDQAKTTLTKEQIKNMLKTNNGQLQLA